MIQCRSPLSHLTVSFETNTCPRGHPCPTCHPSGRTAGVKNRSWAIGFAEAFGGGDLETHRQNSRWAHESLSTLSIAWGPTCSSSDTIDRCCCGCPMRRYSRLSVSSSRRHWLGSTASGLLARRVATVRAAAFSASAWLRKADAVLVSPLPVQSRKTLTFTRTGSTIVRLGGSARTLAKS